jgi:predicted secreted protein
MMVVMMVVMVMMMVVLHWVTLLSSLIFTRRDFIETHQRTSGGVPAGPWHFG